ncbi:unnamed protein product, partial [marine sediment metagenome]
GADFNNIQAAINYCDAIGGEWVILIYPRGEAGAAVYDEGDITPNGGAIITLKGMGESRVRIAPTVAPVAAVIVSSGTLNIEDIVIIAPTAGFPPLRVTGGTCTLTRCILTGVGLGDGVQQIGGVLRLDSCRIAGDIDLSTGACSLVIEGGEYTGTFDIGVGAFNHQIIIRHSDWNGQNWTL